MANFTYALGPWVRRQLGDGYYWDVPDGATDDEINEVLTVAEEHAHALRAQI